MEEDADSDEEGDEEHRRAVANVFLGVEEQRGDQRAADDKDSRENALDDIRNGHPLDADREHARVILDQPTAHVEWLSERDGVQPIRARAEGPF